MALVFLLGITSFLGGEGVALTNQRHNYYLRSQFIKFNISFTPEGRFFDHYRYVFLQDKSQQLKPWEKGGLSSWWEEDPEETTVFTRIKRFFSGNNTFAPPSHMITTSQFGKIDHNNNNNESHDLVINKQDPVNEESQLKIDEDERLERVQKLIAIIVPCIFTIIVLIGVIGNSLIIFIVFYYRKMQSITNILILNLAIADLSFITVCVPFTAVVYALFSWPFGNVACKVYQFMINICAYASVYILVLMALDRFLAVVYPIQSMSLRNTRNAWKSALITWICVIILNTPILYIYQTIPYLVGVDSLTAPTPGTGAGTTTNEVKQVNRYKYVCAIAINGEEFVKGARILYGLFFVFAYLAPLILIIFLYFGLLRRLWGKGDFTNSSTPCSRTCFSKKETTSAHRKKSGASKSDTIKKMPNTFNDDDTKDTLKVNLIGTNKHSSDAHKSTNPSLRRQILMKSLVDQKPNDSSNIKVTTTTRRSQTIQNFWCNCGGGGGNPLSFKKKKNDPLKSRLSVDYCHYQHDTVKNLNDANEVDPSGTTLHHPTSENNLLVTTASNKRGPSEEFLKLQSIKKRKIADAIKSKKKVTRLVTIVIFIFAISWLPNNIIFLIIHFGYYPETVAFMGLQIAAQFFAYMNSCVNPILYAFLSDHFRKAFCQILTKLRIYLCCSKRKSRDNLFNSSYGRRSLTINNTRVLYEGGDAQNDLDHGEFMEPVKETMTNQTNSSPEKISVKKKISGALVKFKLGTSTPKTDNGELSRKPSLALREPDLDVNNNNNNNYRDTQLLPMAFQTNKWPPVSGYEKFASLCENLLIDDDQVIQTGPTVNEENHLECDESSSSIKRSNNGDVPPLPSITTRTVQITKSSSMESNEV